MSDPNTPREVPPELPPEYAEAYRRGYESAVQQAQGSGLDKLDQPGDRLDHPGDSARRPGGPVDGDGDFRPLFADEFQAGGAHSAEPEQPLFRGATFDEDAEARARGTVRPGWSPRCWPAWSSYSCGAYGIGRVLSSNLAGADVAAEKPDGVVISEDGSTSSRGVPSPSQQPSKKPRGQEVRRPDDTATIGGASATSCEDTGRRLGGQQGAATRRATSTTRT